MIKIRSSYSFKRTKYLICAESTWSIDVKGVSLLGNTMMVKWVIWIASINDSSHRSDS